MCYNKSMMEYYASSRREVIVLIRFDSHTHSRFSFDGDPSADPAALCEAAMARSITHLALTDHYEVGNDPEGLNMPYDAAAAKEAVLAAKEAFAGKIVLSYGIEAGQINQYPDLALRFLSEHRFETVIGSVHNLRGKPDFYFWDMRNISEQEFHEHWIAYLKEIREILAIGGFDILAHLTYPVRYLRKAGKRFDLSFDRPLLEEILGTVIDQGILLEVNSSGFRQGIDSPLPDRRILSLYREMGGRLISVGSDAHNPAHIGSDFFKTEAFLLSIGFDRIYFTENKVLTEQLLGQSE